MAMRRIDNTDGETRAHEWIKCSDFVLVERKCFVVRSEYGGSGGEGMFLAKNCISGGDYGFADRETSMHIAEIDDAKDAARLRPRRRDEDIVIVGVSVDNAATEMRESGERFGFEESEEMFSESAGTRVVNVMNMLPSV